MEENIEEAMLESFKSLIEQLEPITKRSIKTCPELVETFSSIDDEKLKSLLESSYEKWFIDYQKDLDLSE